MSKLTTMQRHVLSGAAAREDGAANVPAKMNKAASEKLAAGLIAGKWMREVRTKPGMPVWFRGEDDRALSLVITPAGRKMLGAGDEVSHTRREFATPDASVDKILSNKAIKKQRAAGAVKSAPDQAMRPRPEPTDKSHVRRDEPRSGSKRQVLIDMLSKSEGATIDQMVQALGWLPHTTRAELTRLRQRGLLIARTPRQGQASLYALAAPAPTPEAMTVGKAA